MADVLNLENLKVLWENINEKFARKDDNNIPTRTVFAYKTCNGVPLTPIGGSWNYKTNDITYPMNHPEDLDPNPWGGADNIERPVWMSTKTFAKEPGAESAWSTPTMISGENGAPGADGTNVEFVYKRSKNEWEKPGGTDPDYSLNLPSPQENGYVPEGWNASPEGITDEIQCEWQLNRKKMDDGSWGRWMGPYLWSKWGVNGQDGDGVEYVYKRTNTAVPPALALHAGVTLDSDRYQGRNAYIGIEYVPVDWTDNPEDVSEEFMWCWVSSRKKKDWNSYCEALQREIDNMNEQLNDTENLLDQETIDDYNNKILTHTATIEAHRGLGVSWGAFSQPTLWAKYGEKGMSGYSVKNMYVATSLGFDWVNDMLTDDMRDGKEPLSSVWQDWPEYDRESEDVWGITATWDDIYDRLAPGTRWKGPFLASGVKGKDGLNPNYPVTVFASSPSADLFPKAPTVGMNYEEAMEDGSFITTDDAGNEFTWYQAPTGGNTTTRWFVCNGVIDGDTQEAVQWGDVKPYNGLDGEALPGKYTEYRYCYTDLPDVRPLFDEDYVDEDGNQQYVWDPETQGADYNRNWKLFVEEPEYGENAPKKYLWQIWAIKDPNTQTIQKLSNGKYWLGPIRVSGEPGESVTGQPGPSGVPGAEYENRYQIGNVDGPQIPWSEEYKFIEDLSGQGWDQTISKDAMNNDFLYIWCVQAKFVHEKYIDEETGKEIDNKILDSDGWSDPFRMSGLNALDQPGAITLYASLDNQMDSVPCDEDGKVTQTNLGIQTTFHVYKGINDMPIDKVEIDGEIEGIVYTIEGATLTINEVTSEKDRIVIPLIAYVTEGDKIVTYKQAFTLNKVHLGAPTFVVDLGNENVTIPADQFGMVLDSAFPIKNTLNLFSGTRQINEFTIKPKNDKVTVAVNNHELTIDITRDFFTEEVVNVDFEVEGTLDGKTYKKDVTMRIVILKQGSDSVIYELMPNASNIVYTTDGKYDPPVLEVSAMRKHGAGEAQMMTLADLATEGLTVNYRIDKGDEGTTTAFPQNGLTLAGNDFESSIELTLVNANNEVIDKETLYLLHDGVPAVRYYLQLNRDVVQYDDSGKATDTTPIRCDLIKIDGTTYEQLIECPPFFDLKYSVDGSALKEYTPGTEIVYNGFSDNLDFYFYHADADGTVLLDHDTVIVMKTPRGEKGRIIYPAGTYDNTKLYETTPEMAPYVFDPMDKNFYLLDKETVWVGETQNNQTPSENWRDGDNADYVWKKFEKYEAIYSEIGVFGQALVGSAVFCGDYVFSQQGREWNFENQAYVNSTNYQNFELDNVWGTDDEPARFIPNIMFDFATGNGWIGAKKMSWRTLNDGTMDMRMSGVKMSWEDVDGKPDIEAQVEELQSQYDSANASANLAEKLAQESKNLSDHTIQHINGWADDKIVSFTEQKELIKQGNEIYREYTEVLTAINAYHELVNGKNGWNDSWSSRLGKTLDDFIVSSLGDPNNLNDPDTVAAADMDLYSIYPNVKESIEYHSNSTWSNDSYEYVMNPLSEEESGETIPDRNVEINDSLYNYITSFYNVKTRVLEEFSEKSANFAEALSNLRTGAYFTEWAADGLINEQEMHSMADDLEVAIAENAKIITDYNSIANLVNEDSFDTTTLAAAVTYRNAWAKYNTTMTYYSAVGNKTGDAIQMFDDKSFIVVIDGEDNASHDGYWGNISAYFTAKQGMLDCIAELHAKYAKLQAEEKIQQLFDDLSADGYISETERNALALERDKIMDESERIKTDIASHNQSVADKTKNGTVPSGESPSIYNISTESGSNYATFVDYVTKATGAINYHIGERWNIGAGEQEPIASDGNKGIQIVDTYWGYIAEYYVKKQLLLNEYNGKKGSWEVISRMGTKMTYIGDTGIYTGTMSADNIKGWRIAGLSLESSNHGGLPSDVTWWDWTNINNATTVEDAKTDQTGGTGPKFQLRSDGSGHLASGNISWDTDGKVKFGPGVELNWSAGVPEDEFKLISDVPYFRRFNDNYKNTNVTTLEKYIEYAGLDYANTKPDNKLTMLNVNANRDITTDGTISLFTIFIKKYNPLTGKYDADFPEDERKKLPAMKLCRTYLDGYMPKTNPDANAGEIVDGQNYYSGFSGAGITVASQANGNCNLKKATWRGLTNIRVYLDGDDYRDKYYVDIPVMGWNEDPNLSQIDERITTKLDQYSITSDTISGKTIKSTSTGALYGGTTGPLWQINNNGSGYLAAKQIDWSGDGTITLGDKVTINWSNVNGHETVDQNISNANSTAEGAKSKAEEALTAANGKPDISTVNSAISTELNKFSVKSHKITGDLLLGKTIGSTENVPLTEGTKYQIYTEPDDQGNYIAADYTATSGSTGPAWQIRKDGVGYLASGNVQWDNNGNLTVKGKINGLTGTNIGSGSTIGPWKTFTDSGESIIGDNTSKDNSQNYFGSSGTFKIGGEKGIRKNSGEILFGDGDNGFKLDSNGKFIMGSNVTIRWDDIDKTGANVNDMVTSIDASSITTGTITADRLNVSEIAADVWQANKAEIGELVASEIQAMKITTDRLNTTPGKYGAGTIVVEGNDIKIYDKSQSNEILRLTGSYLGTMPSEATADITGSAKNMIDITSNQKIGDYFTDNGSNSSGSRYKLSGVKKVTTYSVPDDGYSYGYTGSCSCDVCFGLNRRQTNDTSKWMVLVSCKYEIVAKGSAAPKALTSTESPVIVSQDIFKSSNSWFESKTFSWAPNLKAGGEFDVYLKYFVELICDNAGLSTTEFDKILIDSSHQYVALDNVTLKRSINRCDISSYGFRYIVNKNKYVTIDKNGSFKFKNGSYELVVDDSGIGMAFNGIDGGALKRIKPVNKEWRTTGKNVKGYVLVLGDWTETA